MSDTARSTVGYEVGFAEGAKAGRADMKAREACFEPFEDALSMAHAVLNGSYAVIRRRQIDFQSFEDIQNWMGGVAAGIESVGARVGFQTTIEYPHSRPDGGAVTYIFVTRDFGPSESLPK
ncbi:hypothetical protein J2Z19_003785 [Ensifer adhaerens]|uniref:Uncharacterized protein n=1 Tax=Ensifer adhaerens TaxID=106592 RepID=A0ACC5SZJ8_ENSAD|nr:hypothetical protein [Ensifer adhaerens]MBP1874061.1 hypothetical protein [Ensifer adhaerens]